MSKPKEAKETTNGRIYYNADVEQTIPLTLTKNGQEFRVSHTFEPLTTERYFEFCEDAERVGERFKKLSTDTFNPKAQLWKDVAVSRSGYKEANDWKEKTSLFDQIAAINGLLQAHPVDETEIETGEKYDLYDDDALTAVQFRALVGIDGKGAIVTLTHRFREASKAEMDEFLAIESNEPTENSLAGAQKMSRPERLYRLGKKVMVEHEGYAEGSSVPAWHIATTCETFFRREIGRMGKSSPQ